MELFCGDWCLKVQMFKLSEKLRKLNIEQKLLFLATLLIPMLVFVAYVNIIFNETYMILSEYFNPPTGSLDFSCCSSGSYGPFYLTILGFSSVLTLFISSIYTFKLNYTKSVLFLTISSLITYFLLVASFYIMTHNKVISQSNYVIENLDFISFTLFISLLLIWQISVYFRFRNQKLY